MSSSALKLPLWSIVTPIAAWVFLLGALAGFSGAYEILLVVGLIGAVIAAVHHAEVVAHRVGEPFGTLLLALAVTVIEVGLVVALMFAGGKETASLARDTVFAAVMIILNGIVGGCLLVGGSRHREQSFGLLGVSASLTTLAAISVLALVLPNFTETVVGPYYSSSQLTFIAVVSLALYGMFLLVQAVRHRGYFLPEVNLGIEVAHAQRPSARTTAAASLLLITSLVVIVLLAKFLAPTLEKVVAKAGAPRAVVGIIIAFVVLLPEGVSALRAAYANRLQTSLNLALGSALASIGLTIPSVAVVALITGQQLTLGLDAKSTVLLILSIYCAGISLSTGRTTVLQGAVHIVLFLVYLFFAVVP